MPVRRGSIKKSQSSSTVQLQRTELYPHLHSEVSTSWCSPSAGLHSSTESSPRWRAQQPRKHLRLGSVSPSHPIRPKVNLSDFTGHQKNKLHPWSVAVPAQFPLSMAFLHRDLGHWPRKGFHWHRQTSCQEPALSHLPSPLLLLLKSHELCH